MSYSVFELGFLRLFSRCGVLLLIYFNSVELGLLKLIFHVDRDEGFNTVLFIFLFFFKIVIVSLEHNWAEDKNYGKKLLDINGVSKVNDINDNCQAFSDTNDKGWNMLLVELNHFIDYNLPQCIENWQNSYIHHNLFMSRKEFIKIENFSCNCRKSHRNKKSVLVYLQVHLHNWWLVFCLDFGLKVG